MKSSLLAFVLLCLAVPALHAQVDDTDPQYRAICREALDKPYMPPAPDPAFKPDCDATVYYFGIGHPVDYAAARGCAFAEYTQAVTVPSANPFYGAGILSMIYANGQGVPADIDLATRFTCENQGAPAEIEARLDILAHDRETHSIAPFDLCNTATSGGSEGWCESIDARLSDIDRNQKMVTFQATLAPAATAPFNDLQKAEDDFIKQRIDSEVDLSGTDRASLQLEEQNDLRDQFLADLLAVSALGFHETVSYSAANKKLNAAYKPLLHAAEKTHLPRAPKTIPNTTIDYKAVQETQHAWLHLREEWMTFAKAANSAPNADKQTAALVTLERTKQLNDLTGKN